MHAHSAAPGTPVPDERWIRHFHEGPPHGPTLVCFPHAGGSASWFRGFSAIASAHATVVAVQYPGRQDRRGEAMPRTLGEIADAVVTALGALVSRPVALFGHSMGALIAFEVAQRLEELVHSHPPEVLFVSGRRAPSRRRESRNVHLMDDDGLVAEIHGLDGTNSSVLDDPDVRAMILPAVRADYAAIEGYRWAPRSPLSCPVVALTGEQDEQVDLDEMAAWASHTVGPFDLHTLPGGHFYLDEHRGAVVDIVARSLPTA